MKTLILTLSVWLKKGTANTLSHSFLSFVTRVESISLYVTSHLPDASVSVCLMLLTWYWKNTFIM